MRFLICLRVISFTHSPQNTVVTIVGESFSPCRVIFILRTLDLRLDRHPDFDPPQREQLPKVGEKGHFAVTIN